jgi:DNA-directed RNA polymerase subunit M/transcription elongation factor TFIIS
LNDVKPESFEDSKIEQLEVEFPTLEEDLEGKAEFLDNSILNDIIETSSMTELEAELEEEEQTKDDKEESFSYSCKQCNKSWKRKNSWEVHKHRHHPDPEQFKKEAGSNPDNSDSGEKNLDEEQNSPDQKNQKRKKLCPVCGKMAFPFHIKAHTMQQKEGNPDDKPFSCEICGLKYKTSNSLIKHKRKHSDDKRYACEYCGEKFLHWASRRNHIYLQHTGTYLFIFSVLY